VERFLSRIEVVEVKRGFAAVVATDTAAPAGLRDKQPLDLAPVLRDLFGAAQDAAIAPAAFEDVPDRAVVKADEVHVTQAVGGGGTGGGTVRGSACRETEARKRATNSVGRGADLLSYDGDGLAFGGQARDRVFWSASFVPNLAAPFATRPWRFSQ